MLAVKLSVAQVRVLVREEGSSPLDHVTEDQIDKAILKAIKRPDVTHSLLAASAICLIEFDVLARKLCEAMSDGTVLDHEPADQEVMWLFHHGDVPNASEYRVLASAQDIALQQRFLAGRLLTAADLLVDDACADIDAKGRALAVARALFSVAADFEPIAEKVIQAMPPHEWASLLASRKASREENERHRAETGA